MKDEEKKATKMIYIYRKKENQIDIYEIYPSLSNKSCK